MPRRPFRKSVHPPTRPFNSGDLNAVSTKVLDIQNVTVSFDGFKALNNLNFSMDEGELRVIIGPNGAGKTTFLDVITGKTKPTEGCGLLQRAGSAKI
jgi:ABC-type uncharacterized transport system ATPase subunit